MRIDTPRKHVVDSLKYALNPSSIAVVGASRYDGKVGYSEFIMYGTQDPNTKCLSIYIEGMDFPEAFIKACREVVPQKPVVAIKGGCCLCSCCPAKIWSDTGGEIAANKTGDHWSPPPFSPFVLGRLHHFPLKK